MPENSVTMRYPVYVVEFSPTVKVKTVQWIVGKLTSPKAQGGCELDVFYSQPSSNSGLCLFISISTERAMAAAGQMRMRKWDLEGKLRDFNLAEIDRFAIKENYDSVFSQAELLSIIKHEIDSFRATKTIQNQDYLPDNIRFFQGQAIIEKLLRRGVVLSLFPLHDRESLKRLKFDWCTSIVEPQPLEKIRDYFGEGIAFYFAFLGEYSKFLLVPTLVGLFQYLFVSPSFTSNLVFCVIYLLWAFTFLEVWKRKSNELAFLWGTFATYVNYDEPRANFKGDLQVNPVNGELEPFYPRWKTLCKVYLVSFPFVLLCLAAGFWAMMLSFEAETAIKDLEYSELVTFGLIQIPGLIYAAAVWLASQYYRRVATLLTEWENHRTESQFERNRVTKILLFDFVNYIVFLFYIAFYKQDIDLLRSQLALMLIVFQLLNHFTETALPYATRPKVVNSDSSEDWKTRYSVLEKSDCQLLEPDEPLVKQALKEILLQPYIGTHEDYLELFIQLSYVLLFIVTYPLASLWALLSNIIELRADAFKLCGVFRRPSACRVRHIGAWLPAFQFLCALSVITNCATVFLMSCQQDAEQGVQDQSWSRAITCLATEHLLLALQVLLHIIVPSVPQWIKTQLAAANNA